MPRPETITQEDIDRWDLQWLEYLQKDRPTLLQQALLQTTDSQCYAERWRAGCWLHEQLRAARCPPDLAEEIVFANGQVMAASWDATGGDPWIPTVQALEDFGREEWLTPGNELAAQLFEFFGVPQRMARIFDTYTPHEVLSMLRRETWPEVPGRKRRR